MVLSAALLVLVQSSIGMAVNLYVTVPAHHSGAHPSDYLSGSVQSVAWAVAHGALALAIHAALGLVLALMAISVAVRGVRLRRRAIGAWAVLAGLCVIGAGFNGASFLDFNNGVSSLIMAVYPRSPPSRAMRFCCSCWERRTVTVFAPAPAVGVQAPPDSPGPVM